MKGEREYAVILLSIGVAGLLVAVYFNRGNIQRGWRRMLASDEDLDCLDLLHKIALAKIEFETSLGALEAEFRNYTKAVADIQKTTSTESTNLLESDTVKLAQLEKSVAELDSDLDFVFSKLDGVVSNNEIIKKDRKHLVSQFESCGHRIDALKTDIRDVKQNDYDYISALTADI